MQAFINAIRAQGTRKSVKKRTILLYQGEVPRSGYVLEKGLVKAYNINANGSEQLAAFHTAGDIFPDYWLFGKTSAALYYYEALTDCSLLAASREVIQETLAQKHHALQVVFDSVMTSYTGALMRITALEQSRANEKIMFTLYYLLFRYGHETRKGVFSVRLGLTHTLIADMVGLTRETTAFELGKLKKSGVIRYSTKEYVINKTRLEQALGEDSFNSLTL